LVGWICRSTLRVISSQNEILKFLENPSISCSLRTASKVHTN
jgi:hypothetical protein